MYVTQNNLFVQEAQAQSEIIHLLQETIISW